VPSYIYQCENKHREEHTHSMTETPALTCDLCQTPMTRIPSAITTTFKGSGFYSTDKGNA
jgi:putative FmdB family regulatory protein